jgi:hypothetical protein
MAVSLCRADGVLTALAAWTPGTGGGGISQRRSPPARSRGGAHARFRHPPVSDGQTLASAMRCSSRSALPTAARCSRKPQLPAWSDGAVQLTQGQAPIVQRAQHQRHNSRVRARVVDGEPLRAAGDDRHWDSGIIGGTLGQSTKVGLRLHGDHRADRGWVVREVHAIAGPDLGDASGEVREQFTPESCHALGLDARCQALAHPRESGTRPVQERSVHAHPNTLMRRLDSWNHPDAPLCHRLQWRRDRRSYPSPLRAGLRHGVPARHHGCGCRFPRRRTRPSPGRNRPVRSL